MDTTRSSERHVRHSFTLAFFFLLYNKNLQERQDIAYKDAMEIVAQLGGDVTANAFVVGAMLGLLIGYKKIPSTMSQDVTQFDCSASDVKGIKRPEMFSMKKNGTYYMRGLIKSMPLSGHKIQ